MRLQRQAEQARLRGRIARQLRHAVAMHDAAVVHHHGLVAQRLGEAEILDVMVYTPTEAPLPEAIKEVA